MALTNGAEARKLSVEDGWICCPSCGKHMLRIEPETTATHLPAVCRRCKRAFVLTIERGLSARRLSP